MAKPYQEVEKDNELHSDEILVKFPQANNVIYSPLEIAGSARGTWYFEASFPIKLLDENGKEIARGHAKAQSDWMTENFVPFLASLSFEKPEGVKGMLVLEKDNPSGLPENDASIKIPIRFH